MKEYVLFRIDQLPVSTVFLIIIDDLIYVNR